MEADRTDRGANRIESLDLSCARLFDEVPCYISIQDRGFRVLEANRKLIDDFGDPISQFCYSVYKQRAHRCPECPVARTFSDGLEHSSEEIILDRRGAPHNVVVNTRALRDRSGAVAAVMELFTDITDIRVLEEKLASLGSVIAGTAHSIKNVLEGLRGGIYVANLGFRDNKQDDIRTGWEMVERNVARLSAMIMDMLYCAKERSPRHIPVSLPAAVREIAGQFAQRARDLGVEVETDVAPGVGDVTGEPRDIRSLLSNLIGNAIDACGQDQGDHEKQHRVIVRVFRESAYAVIEVQDNGAGMDEETRNKLFTRFFSTKGAFGTGLGLMVCHKVVAEHRGSISVESKPDVGSRFTARLPIE